MQIHMTRLLMAKGLWQYGEGTGPPGPENREALSRFEKGKQKAMATSVMGIQSQLIYLVTSCTTQNVFGTYSKTI